MIEDIIKGYIAGFFDGEGTVCINKDKRCNYYGLIVSIPNTCYDVLKRIQLKCSGNIIEEKYRKKKNGELTKQKWQWSASSYNAFKFLQYIKCYSVVKSKQVELGIKFFNEIKNYSGYNKGIPTTEIQKRKWFYNEIKRLNHESCSSEVIKDYDNEIKKLEINKDIKNGNQKVLSTSNDKIYADISEIYKMYDVKEKNKTIEDKIINMPDDAFIGYFAGFFDAEGCVRITKNYTLTTFIKQTKYNILKMIYDKYGGVVEKTEKMKKTDIGNERKQQWVWRINSNDCVPFLKSVTNFSITKRTQIDVAIEYQTLIKTKYNPSFGRNSLDSTEINKRELYRQKLIELKKQNNEADVEEFKCNIIDKNNNKNIKTLADYD